MEEVKETKVEEPRQQPPKKKKSRALYWIVVIAGTIFIMVGSCYIGAKLGEYFYDFEKGITEKEESNSNSNETSNVESNVNSNETSNTTTTPSTTELSADERYKNYLTALANNIKSKFKEPTDTDLNRYYSYEYVDNADSGNKYSVKLNNKLELILNYDAADSKLKNYKISDNVVQFYLIETGNGGINTLYYITTDGSLYSADVETGETVKTTKEKYKNIVSIQQGTAGGPSSVAIPIFIDIDGNIYDNQN